MAIVKIEHVLMQTVGSYDASIEGIELTDHDLFIGRVVTPGGVIVTRWDRNGTCRGGGSDTNISVASLSDLLASAKKLGADA
jgi:hypothetical protein